MLDILGYIVLFIACLIIWLVACEKIENRPKLMLVGYLTGVIVTVIIGCRWLKPEIEKYENKVNELTTKLYESYSLIDSLEQEKM